MKCIFVQNKKIIQNTSDYVIITSLLQRTPELTQKQAPYFSTSRKDKPVCWKGDQAHCFPGEGTEEADLCEDVLLDCFSVGLQFCSSSGECGSDTCDNLEN